MPSPHPLSQKDPRWTNVKVGDSPYTVGQIGCTITAIAMFSAKDPAWMARNLDFNQNGAILWESVKKTGDLAFVWRQWASPQARILEGLKNGEAVIVEIAAGNSYGGKHWLAVKSADKTGLTVIDPDINTNTGVERYLGWGSVTGSSHFQVLTNSNMSEKDQAINVIKELEPTNGELRTKRIIDAINTNDWSYFAFEYSVIQKGLTEAKQDINELKKKLAEAPEAAVVEQLEELQNQIEGKNNIIEELVEEVDQAHKELEKLEADRLRVYNLLQEAEKKPEPENSSSKPIWKSKKVWVTGISIISMLAVNQGWISPEGAQEVGNELIAILEEVGVLGIAAVGSAYVIGQSQVDKANIQKDK